MISGLLCRARAACKAFTPLRLPLGDQVETDIELMRQFDQRLLALDRGQSHYRLEGPRMVLAWSFAQTLLLYSHSGSAHAETPGLRPEK
jgi:hypothetical protein